MLQLSTPSQTTRLFRNGNSQAVRIPAALAFAHTGMPIEIERIGSELRIRPAGRKLDGLMKVFSKFPKNFTVEGRGEQTQAPRESL